MQCLSQLGTNEINDANFCIKVVLIYNGECSLFYTYDKQWEVAFVLSWNMYKNIFQE